MSEKRSAKSCYQSNFGGGFITGPQLVAEKVFALRAFAEKKQLKDRFWQDDLYKKDFIFQCKLANDLLSGKGKGGGPYEISTILNVLNGESVKFKKIKSLGALYALGPLLRAEQARQDKEAATLEVATPIIEPEIILETRPQINKKISLLDKLKGL
jgi:hypothetical protein